MVSSPSIKTIFGWDNVVLCGQYILDRKLVRGRRRSKPSWPAFRYPDRTVCSEVSAPHHPRRCFERTRDDGDGGGQIQRESRHHSRHARLRAYLHRRGRKLQRRGIQRHFRTLALNPRRNTRVDNHGGIRVHSQLGTDQKGREQTQGR